MKCCGLSGKCQKAMCIHMETAFNFRIFQDDVENHGAPIKNPWSTGRRKRGQVTVLVIRSWEVKS